MLTFLLFLYAYIPLQTLLLAYILIHFAVHIISSSSLELGDKIIQIHCSDDNFFPKGIIYCILNSYLRKVFSGVMPLSVVSYRASQANPHKYSKSRGRTKFGSYVLTEMMHMEMELDLLKIAVSILVDN